MVVFEALYCPKWFCSIDSLIDIVSALVVLLLAWSAWSYSRLDRSERNFRGIALGFAFLAAAFLAKVGFDYLLHHELIEMHTLVVQYAFGTELSDWLMVFALYAYKFLMLGGLYLLFSVLDKPTRPSTVLVFALFALAIYFTEASYFVFHALVSLLAVLITVGYVRRARENKNRTTRFVASAFGVLFASSALFMFAQFDLSLYLLAKALQLIAFAILLYIFIVLHRHASPHGKKRSRLDIIADMLETIIDRRGEIKPTHLMYKSNLSHGQMKGYLEELVAKKLVQKNRRNDHEYILITDEGYKFVQKIKEMREFAEGFGL